MSVTEPLSPLDATFLELEEADPTRAHAHRRPADLRPLPGGGPPTLDARATPSRAPPGRAAALPPAPLEPTHRRPALADWEPDAALRHGGARHAARRCPRRAASASCWTGPRDFWSHRLDRSRPLWRDGAPRGPRRRPLGAGDQDPSLPGRRRRLGRRRQLLLDASRTPRAGRARSAARRQNGGRHCAHAPRRRAARGLGAAVGLVAPSRRAATRLERRPRPRRAAACATSSSPRRTPASTSPLGEHRRLAVADVPLDELKAIKRALGGTVNDVVLALVTAGLRELLLARGETPPAAGLRAMVPVNVRAPPSTWRSATASARCSCTCRSPSADRARATGASAPRPTRAEGRPPGRRRPALWSSSPGSRRPSCTACSRSRCSRRACST